jgi:DNA-binding MarR family transcriptional regulator
MMTEPDEQRLVAWRALLTTQARAVEAIERDLAAADLVPLTWYDVLVALWEAPDHRLRLHELAREVVLSRSGLTRLVDRLEAAGLLRRESCADDRRGAFAVLTPEGRAAQLKAWPIYARGISAHFGRHLSDTEATILATALGRVNVNSPRR